MGKGAVRLPKILVLTCSPERGTGAHLDAHSMSQLHTSSRSLFLGAAIPTRARLCVQNFCGGCNLAETHSEHNASGFHARASRTMCARAAHMDRS